MVDSLYMLKNQLLLNIYTIKRKHGSFLYYEVKNEISEEEKMGLGIL